MPQDQLVSGYETLTKRGVQIVERRSLMEQFREEAAALLAQRPTINPGESA